jgi:hypothetical protein
VEGPGDDDLKGGAMEAADLAGGKLDALGSSAGEIGERDGRETRHKRERETGAERLRPSNYEERSQPASRGYILSGAVPLPPLPIQTAAGLGRLRSAPGTLQANTGKTRRRQQRRPDMMNGACHSFRAAATVMVPYIYRSLGTLFY